jgi:hypothetical protein
MASRPVNPTPPDQGPAERLALQTFARLDKTALGIAFGTTASVAIFLATLILVLKGGDVVGPNLALLAQFFGAYSVTPVGSLIGAAYGFVAGFTMGWIVAALRNAVMAVYLRVIRSSAELAAVQSFMDDM